MTNAHGTAAPASNTARDRLIVALDVESVNEARRIVDEVGEYTGAFKVGLQLFTAAGAEFVREMCSAGHRIFLDLKFHDIPNTVAKAGVEAARMGVWMFNVHASGGNEMMSRTVSEVAFACEREGLERPKIIGVTVLTSSADDTLRETGIERTAAQQVERLSLLTKRAGLDGVVASPLEIGSIRNKCGEGFLIVTPGVRPLNAANDDQRRVMTPGEAARRGSDHLVIGRPITWAPDRAQAAREILEEITEAIQ